MSVFEWFEYICYLVLYSFIIDLEIAYGKKVRDHKDNTLGV
jgi:hypothetical protein